MIKFTIPGPPQGKGRPRFTKSGHTYTPAKTAEYEKLVQAEYIRQCVDSHCMVNRSIFGSTHFSRSPKTPAKNVTRKC